MGNILLDNLSQIVFLVINVWSGQFDFNKIMQCVIVVKKLQLVNMSKVMVLIFNRENITMFNTKPNLKICQECLLLHMKYLGYNIRPVSGILTSKELLHNFGSMKISYKSQKQCRFAKIINDCYDVYIKLLHGVITIQI